jgi:tetratricopeptide (TPR) repeat protein
MFECGAPAALVGALLFAVHPGHTEAVAWVAARADLLATTFTLLAVVVTRWMVAERRVTRGRAGALAAVAAASFAAAASKEPGVLTPRLVGAGALIRATPRGGAREARTAGRDVVWSTVAASGVGVAAYVGLRLLNRSEESGLVGTIDAASLWHLFLAFGFYVQRLLVPVGLRAYVPEVPNGVAGVSFALVGLVGIVAAALAGSPRVRFAVLWTVVTLAPSMLVAISDVLAMPVSERYLYLPSVGLALLVAFAAERVPPARSRAAIAAAAAVGIALATATVMRNPVWHDELTLWSAVAAEEPGYGLPYLNLGQALVDAGRTADAEQAYRHGLAAKANPATVRDLYVDLGHLQLQAKRYDEAFDTFTRANAIAPHASAYYGLGAIHRTRARAALAAGDMQTAGVEFAEARQALEAALRINWRHYKSQYVLATVLYLTGDYADALEHFRKVVEVAPDSELGPQAAESVRQLTAWLADPANRAALSQQAPPP